MKAAQINAYGGKDVMTIVDTAEIPTAGPGQVLVAVNAAGLNPFDWKVREGYMKEFIPLKLPATLGGDVAGTVAEVGDDVSGFKVGQSVYGLANAAGGHGSYAEFTAVNAGQLASKPTSLDFNHAAALPLAATSAYQALVDHIGLKSGQRILIHGGSGGIGSYAIQIAKGIGAYVATTTSEPEYNFVKSLGADEVIDYKSQDFSTLLSDFDAVFDTVGGETNTKSYAVLKPGGVLVSMVEQPNEELVNSSGITYIQQFSKATTERLNKITELIDSGIVTINIDKVFPLADAAEALEYLKTGHTRGKVVIQVK